MSATRDWKHIKLSSADGVTEAILHTDGGALVWTATASDELTDLLTWTATDADTKVLILGGTGKDFCAKIDPTEFAARSWRQIWAGEQRLLNAMLELNTIVISAVNGPAYIHSDIAILADIVLAAPEAKFGDPYHFSRNVVPGDGVALVWGSVLGSSRANYFFLTGQRLGAEEAKQLGAVHEIVAGDQLLERARDLAGGLAKRPAALLAYSKAALRLRDRRHFREDLSHSLSLQGLSMHALGYAKPE